MRAGSLDRRIDIQSFSNTVDANRVPVETWTTVATVPAQIVQASTDEFLRGYGEIDAMMVVFRIRYLSGITTAHRVRFEGRPLNIREVKEIGRRRGLELRCEEVRS